MTRELDHAVEIRVRRHGDATNAIPAAVGYNFRRLLAWLTALLCLLCREIGSSQNPDNSFALSLQAG